MNFKIKIFLSLSLFYFLSITFSFAQSVTRLNLRNINEENGLSDNEVQCVYKDRNGFVWIGTASGLNLMNGSGITVYKHSAAKPHTVSNNNITAITGDSKGLIWVGTQKGLNLLNPVTNTFTAYPIDTLNKNFDNVVRCLAVDRNDNLFIGTFSGLYFFDRTTRKMKHTPMGEDKREDLANNMITGIALDSSAVLWITTFNGLWSLNTKNNQITHEIGAHKDRLSNGLFTQLITDHSGKIWIGTWEDGLIEFDPATKRIITHQYSKVIKSLAEVKQPGNSYLVLINGISNAFDPDKNVFLHPVFSANVSHKLEIENLYTSRDNWLWTGSKEGVYFCNPAKTLFRHHRFPTPVTGQNVSLLEWNNKMLVSGANKDFLKLYDSSLNEITDYGKGFSGLKLSCLSLAFSGKETLKAGTTDGIADINLITHRETLDSLSYLAGNFEAGNFITHLLKDRKNAWWIFPWRNGIWQADSAGKKFHQVFRNFITEGGYPKPLVIADAVEDDENNIWFADLDEGIINYNRATHRFSKPFLKQIGERIPVQEILFYHGVLYSFSGEEIFNWKPDQSSFEKIGLPPQMDKPISSIAFDSTGHLWIATQKGLLAYDPHSKNYERFTTADGLISNNMDGNLYCMKSGEMIFGSADYLTSFRPEKVLSSVNETPHLTLTGVTADGIPVIFDTAKKEIFNPTVNAFTFKWAVTDYNNPLSNRYYYRLMNTDTNWRFAGDRGQVDFANLSPGNYTLLLKGENSNGIAAANIIRLHFEKLAPFWQTGWFFGLLILLTGLAFYGLYRYRLSQILRIEKLRNKISYDLHDDIGSTLSSISIMSEIALQHEKESKNSLRLTEIKENSISLMDRMDDIVWSINPKNDSMESLLLRIKTFAAKLFEAREINYSFDAVENIKDVPVQMEYRQHIYLIMKEAINNLVKYSRCTEAQIKAEYHPPFLSIIIKDNGKGFDASQNSFGNGLNSMRNRAKEMQAFLEIASAINKGTTVSLKVKIN